MKGNAFCRIHSLNHHKFIKAKPKIRKHFSKSKILPLHPRQEERIYSPIGHHYKNSRYEEESSKDGEWWNKERRKSGVRSRSPHSVHRKKFSSKNYSKISSKWEQDFGLFGLEMIGLAGESKQLGDISKN
jgi:hypothetical protein